MLYLDYSRADGEWIPNRLGGRENLDAIDFLRQLNDAIDEEFPDAATFAEESTAWPMVTGPTAHGGLGFSYKWDMGWMHDTLQYIRREPVHRRFHHDEITFRGVYAFTERYVMPLSHDEVVHGKGSLLGKMPGDEWQRFANLRLLYGMMWAQPGKKLLFMGGELATPSEWNHEATLDWSLHDAPLHDGVRRWLTALNDALPQRAGAGAWRRRPGGVQLDHRRRRHAQRVRLAACRSDGRGATDPRRDQRHPDRPLRLPGRRAAGRPVDRAAQLRRRGLRRQRHGQPRRRGGRRPAVARLPPLPPPDPPPTGRRPPPPGRATRTDSDAPRSR